MRYPVVLLTLMLSGLAVAATPPEHPPGLKPVPDGAPGPGDAPAVTIKPSSQGRVVEYRANGKLYMLKVIPRVGKARQDSLDSGMRPPMWVVKEF
ncbi:MAG: hypothetical protein ABS92_07835 [Thiobacillus sp. SCN 63-374]|nr:MAG: hypothetical protein ABS92_07835 [Thiobacillus sp. SCN 63-374]